MNLAWRLANRLYRPPKSTDTVIIGQECFGAADGSIICFRGENYVLQKPSMRVRFHNWLIRVGDR